MGLLCTADSQPVIAERAGSESPFLFICDHAGRAVPAALGRLGLPDACFDQHIAWDIGAAAVTRQLAAKLAAPAILQRFSRLVIDCNRDPATAQAIPEVSDGVVIPGNQGLDGQARQARVEAIHAPYHAAIAAELDRRAARRLPTMLVFVHSFTPRMDGVDRPWRFGVIREPGSRFSQGVLARLQAAGGFEVGDNLPYAMDGTDYSAPTHAFARGLDYLELEMRQDTVADAAGQAATVAILSDVLTEALAAL
ncbi:N-formylglutamate amidohydrolase [Caulobacter sp. KR2-114]|uniref:N-formylglutamate amidohydrolase n=1 Tax=Caulobacter sp. KR2-114 TaxID=3400912 RepID=UPI003C0A3B8B